jgi:cytochrome subunit of sulfide dehydrogenase
MRTVLICTAAVLALSAGADDTLIAECDSCHGTDGSSADELIPVIHGLSEFYLDDNLHQYADEYRPCPEATYPEGAERAGETTTMCAIVQALSDDQIAELATHYAALEFVFTDQPFDPVRADRGAQLHELTCKRCHADAGTDPWDDAGFLAGQRTAYLRQSLEEFRSGARPYPDKMQVKVEPLTDADIEALLDFWAREGSARR